MANVDEVAARARPMSDAHDVFISYSSKDKPTADAVCALLERDGVRCWVAPRDILPGQGWEASIVRAIGAARVFILVFSGPANESAQVRREVSRAASHEIPIVPFRIEAVAPNETLEFYISSPHWLDALDPPLERHIERLSSVVQRLLQREESPPPVTPAVASSPAPAAAGAPLETVPSKPPIGRRAIPALLAGGGAAALLAAVLLVLHTTPPHAAAGTAAAAASAPATPAVSTIAPDPAAALVGRWSIAGLGCASPIVFAENDDGITRTFAGATVGVKPAPSSAGGRLMFRADDGARYEVRDRDVSVIPAGARRPMALTRCVD
jgi:hypothetical protein